MRKYMDDFELAKLSLAQKVRDLCMDFMREHGRGFMLLNVSPGREATLSFDAQGKTCVGRKHDVIVNAWTEREFRGLMSKDSIVDEEYDDEDELD